MISYWEWYKYFEKLGLDKEYLVSFKKRWIVKKKEQPNAR